MTLLNRGQQRSNNVHSIHENEIVNRNYERENVNLRNLMYDEMILFISYVIMLYRTLKHKLRIFVLNMLDLNEDPALDHHMDEINDNYGNDDYGEYSEYGDETISITGERPKIDVLINNRYKDSMLIDSGSCTNLISESKLDMIEKLTGNQLPKLKNRGAEIV